MDIRTLDKRMQKFKFEAFSFIGDNQFVYLHCKVLVCNATDPNSRCAQGCVQREKRALATQISKDEEVHVSQGPFMRGDDEEETKLEETVKDMRDTGKSGEFIHREFNVRCSFHDVTLTFITAIQLLVLVFEWRRPFDNLLVCSAGVLCVVTFGHGMFVGWSVA